MQAASIVYAICPFCKKSIKITDDPKAVSLCAFCGQQLTGEILSKHDAYVDFARSNAEYNDAKLYFDNTDFRGAEYHFKNALRYNANNYLANYYAGLCEVYENEGSEGYSVSHKLITTLLESVIKMENSNIELRYRIGFLTAALNEIGIMILSEYNKIQQQFSELMTRKAARAKMMALLDAVNQLQSIDKELLLIFEQAVAQAIASIVNIAIRGCFDAAMPACFGLSDVETCSDSEYKLIMQYYKNLAAFMTVIDPTFSVQSHSPDFSENIRFNKEVLILIDNYYMYNMDNSKHMLSITGELLDTLVSECMSAIKLTYYTCVRNIVPNKNDQLRIGLINQAVIMCCEVLRPRLYIDNKKRVMVITHSINNIKSVTAYLNIMINGIPEPLKRTAGDVIEGFFKEVYAVLDLYYPSVVKSYSRLVNKMKRQGESDDLRYYRNFLFQTACATAIASTDSIKFFNHKMKYRILLLKLSKLVCEEFLLLCDYQIEQIEASPKYRELLTLYADLDGDLIYLNKIK